MLANGWYYTSMQEDTPARKKKTTFQPPEDLIERLRDLALLHRRSLNQELVVALERYVEIETAEAAQTPTKHSRP